MLIHRAPRLFQVCPLLEGERLRGLDHRVVGKRADNVLADFLRWRPEIAKASATREEDRAIAHGFTKRTTIVRPEIADESGPANAERLETCELAKVDGAVADV